MTSPSETKVLFISPLKGATGGIRSWTERIVQHGLSDGYRIHVVDTGLCNKPRIRLTSSWAGEGNRTVRIIASLLWQLTFVRPHIIHLNCSLSRRGVVRDLVCTLLVRLWNIPVVVHYRGNVPEFRGGGNGISWWALRKLTNLSKLNIAMNRDSLACLADLQHGEQRDPILLPGFIQDSAFRYRTVCIVKPSDHIKVIYAGWINVVKGCREILAIARQLPKVEFILLGPTKADMERHLQALPANVTLGGEVPPNIVLQQMSASDLFLFPTSHPEGFPNAVLEAMAVGLPVVATRVGAIPEMIEDGKGGLLVNSLDTDELVSTLQTLIANPEMRLQMGEFNRRKAQTEYSYSVVIPRLISLYQQVLQHSNH